MCVKLIRANSIPRPNLRLQACEMQHNENFTFYCNSSRLASFAFKSMPISPHFLCQRTQIDQNYQKKKTRNRGGWIVAKNQDVGKLLNQAMQLQERLKFLRKTVERQAMRTEPETLPTRCGKEKLPWQPANLRRCPSDDCRDTSVPEGQASRCCTFAPHTQDCLETTASLIASFEGTHFTPRKHLACMKRGRNFFSAKTSLGSYQWTCIMQ